MIIDFTLGFKHFKSKHTPRAGIVPINRTRILRCLNQVIFTGSVIKEKLVIL